MQPLHISHLSIASCIGAGLGPTLQALRAGQSGLRPRQYAGGLETYVGAVDALDDFRLEEALARFDCRNNRLAALALRQDGFADAVAQRRERYGARRIGVFLGTSTSGIEETELAYRRRDPETGALPPDFCHYAETHNTFSVARFVAHALQLDGPAIAISAACATTAKAFGNAARMIEAGVCDAAIVGGADTLCATTLYGFRSLGLMSTQPCRPFDAARDGISIGEAGACALVEKADRTLPDDAVLLRGFGESSDAYHMSSPDPDGGGARLAMERALASAGLQPDDIDYVNLHGTATSAGDSAEDRAVTGLFGTDMPCSSTKGLTGHTLGASGIVESVISVLALRNGFLPGGSTTQTLDPTLQSRYLIARQDTVPERVISNSFGFGGSNCSLIFERAR